MLTEVSSRTKPRAMPRSRSAVSLAPGVELSVRELDGVSDGPMLAMVAGVHGDEVEGITALEDWLAGLRLDAGRVLAIPSRIRRLWPPEPA
jgi:predicted deacylase